MNQENNDLLNLKSMLAVVAVYNIAQELNAEHLPALMII